MVDLSVTVGGIPLQSCIYNGSGPRCGTVEALQKLAASKSGALLTKSATLQAQTGNPHPRVYHTDSASYNSEGLPNKGIDYYISKANYDAIIGSANTKKSYIVSLSGKNTSDNLQMLKQISLQKHIDGIELNLACPNVIGKPILGYDPDQINNVLSQIAKLQNLPPLGIKLPPYLDLIQIKKTAEIINKYDIVKYIVCVNTIGNTLVVSELTDAPVIRSNRGLAGGSGNSVLKHIGLANVREFRIHLKATIDIVGIGGIATGRDVYEYLLVGAQAVQVATAHWREGPSCFQRFETELQATLQSKGVTALSEVRGKLKEYTREPRPAKTATKGAAPIQPAFHFYQYLSAVLAVVVGILYTKLQSLNQ